MTGSFNSMAGNTSSPESSFIQLRKPASSEMKVLRVRKNPLPTSGRGASRTAKSASTGFPCGLLASTTECIISGVLVMSVFCERGCLIRHKKATRRWLSHCTRISSEFVTNSNAKLLSWSQLSPCKRARCIPTLNTITVLQDVSTVKDYFEGAIFSIA